MINRFSSSALLVSFALLLGSCQPALKQERTVSPTVAFTIDLSDPTDDLFHVTVNVQHLAAGNNIYHLASTAPGTYSLLDFGRFVKSFKAFDSKGNEIPTEKISTNKWKIADPERLAVLRYDIEDSFDAEETDNPVMPMGGSGIDTNYAVFNTFAVVGYFEGLQSHPVRMKLQSKKGWMIGTALDVDSEGHFVAETFDRLADSPVLMGDLTYERTKVNDIDVDIYVFAVDTAISAKKVLAMADDVLQSAGAFIGYSPVPYYKFLFVLLDGPTFQRYGLRGAGALEHSYSSLYVMPTTPGSIGQLQSTMAHEFMHILTPLNLHSEVIHSFNFADPTPSEHLWLYEGVTEWVSDIMQLRSGLISADEFLRQFSQKLTIDENFDQTMSLSSMALNVYKPEGRRQFGNVYQRGAATAALLDIRLLELSKGTRGLREVFLELLSAYGKKRPFPEREFFDVLVKATYPEIRQFVDDYIRGSKPLPYKEYMAKLGYEYVGEKPSNDGRPLIGIQISGNQDGLTIAGVDDRAKEFGLQEGDGIVKFLGEEITPRSGARIFGKLATMKPGEPYEMIVRRGDKEVTINGKLLTRMDRHIFAEMKNLTETQKFLRERWLKNL